MCYDSWSIGIYSGESPFRLSPDTRAANPVLTASDINSISALFVADPFMIRVDAVWYMFFEVFNCETGKGEIGLAVSYDCAKWSYQSIVLAESFHLSYPYLVRFGNEFLLVPECHRGGALRIYRASEFPMSWKLAMQPFPKRCVDPCLFKHRDLWWMFWADANGLHDTLRLAFAYELSGEWTEHPRSPIVRGDPSMARPAGRVIAVGDCLVRFAQDCSAHYGQSVRAFEITSLTQTEYTEKEHSGSPALKGSGTGWNGTQMHHVDAHLVADQWWLACVDGYPCPLAYPGHPGT